MPLKSIIESLLFVSVKPLSLQKLAQLTKAKTEEVEEAIESLIQEYDSQNKGIWIIRHAEKVQMVSHPQNTKIVQEYLKEELTGELTPPGLETLTIIAYLGPITKNRLEQIRGVNCSLILRNLMIKGLIEAHEDKKNMTTKYNVTFDFLRYLGIKSVKELPDYERLSKNEILTNLE